MNAAHRGHHLMSAILDILHAGSHQTERIQKQITRHHKQQESSAHQTMQSSTFMHLETLHYCPSDNHHNHMTLDGALQGTDETQGVICACSPFFPRYLQGLKD